MKGKICLVTGATAGIGMATVAGLLKMKAQVILHGRNASSVSSAVDQLSNFQSYPDQLSSVTADLSSWDSIDKMAAEIVKTQPRIDVLVHNAGAIYKNRETNAQGCEMQLAVNHLAPFRLTHLLAGLLQNAPAARVISVASNAHYRAVLNFEDLQQKQRYSSFDVYCQTKLANVMFSAALARRFEGSNMCAHALHPGVVRTGIGSKHMGWLNWAWKLFTLFAIDPAKGAATSLHVASSEEAANSNGLYWDKSAPRQASEEALNIKNQERLWKVSLQLLNLEDAFLSTGSS